MRYPPEHKKQTRERILEAAARQFRAHGFAETGVGAIMREAELTHGGFYAHFDSKDALIAEVIATNFGGVSERFESQFDGLDGAEWLRAWVTGYLGEGHHAHPEMGCPLPSLSSEIGRSGAEARRSYTKVLERRLDVVSAHVPAPRPESERRVLAAIAQMAGALLIARAIEGPLADRVRAAARDEAIATLLGREGDGSSTDAPSGPVASDAPSPTESSAPSPTASGASPPSPPSSPARHSADVPRPGTARTEHDR